MSDNETAKGCGACLLVTGVLLTVILVPLSFSYVEYYEYGLNQRKTTGSVDLSRVYDAGRYSTGPDHQFIVYQGKFFSYSFASWVSVTLHHRFQLHPFVFTLDFLFLGGDDGCVALGD